jgi:hypothetical protein
MSHRSTAETAYRQLEFGFRNINAKETSAITPLMAPDVQRPKPYGNWYEVETKVARFLVKATHEAFVPHELINHLNSAVNPYAAVKRTNADLFGLVMDDVLDGVRIDELPAATANRYDQNNHENVVYISGTQ